VLSVLGCLSPSLLSVIFDNVFFTNESQSLTLQIITEYFVDKERYSHLIILHMNVSYCIGIIVMLATGTMNVMYLLNVCGMFKIAR